jgi:hypothetical protein
MPTMAGSRSPNYPAVGLPDAIESIQKLHKSAGKAVLAPEDAARAMGYNALHGPARSRISALRKFGLIDDTAGGIRLSPTALAILFPSSEDERRSTLLEAALRPDLFRELAANFRSAPDQMLLGRLVREGFTEAGAKAAIASFRATMSLAGGEDADYNPGEGEETPEMDAGFSTPIAPPARTPKVTQSLVFPLPNGAQAHISVVGGPLTKQAVETMAKYLDLAKDTLSDDEADVPISPGPASPIEPEPPSEQSPDAAPDSAS